MIIVWFAAILTSLRDNHSSIFNQLPYRARLRIPSLAFLPRRVASNTYVRLLRPPQLLTSPSKAFLSNPAPLKLPVSVLLADEDALTSPGLTPVFNFILQMIEVPSPFSPILQPLLFISSSKSFLVIPVPSQNFCISASMSMSSFASDKLLDLKPNQNPSPLSRALSLLKSLTVPPLHSQPRRAPASLKPPPISNILHIPNSTCPIFTQQRQPAAAEEAAGPSTKRNAAPCPCPVFDKADHELLPAASLGEPSKRDSELSES
nr:hypothetical protein Iba_chr07aCG14180 [Ipomoea batatas]